VPSLTGLGFVLSFPNAHARGNEMSAQRGWNCRGKVIVKGTKNKDGGLDEISVEECSITVDGVRWRYQRAGFGPALLLVHGLLGYSFSWRFAIKALAPCATVYAVDLPGAGLSDCRIGMDCRLRSLGQQVLGMMAAASAHTRFSRLLLVAPANPWSARGKFLSLALSNPVVAPLFTMAAPRLRFVQEHYLRRLYADPDRIRPGTLEGYTQPLLRRGGFDHSLGVLRSWNRDLQELECVLPRIRDIPTLLIWGSCDAAVDPASAGRLKAQFRQCELIMLAGVGHLPYEEAPDDFNPAVVRFLRCRDADQACDVGVGVPARAATS
jgi:pimeloyl-ACP methyl ester carboxylesterase